MHEKTGVEATSLEFSLSQLLDGLINPIEWVWLVVSLGYV